MASRLVHSFNHTFNINYEIINPKAKHEIVFLHGWGSNKEVMKRAFASQFSDFKHIYIDLPGFGKSSCGISLDTQSYTKIINMFLDEINSKRDVVVGHSFGGKVATLLEPKLLVLLSSAGVKIPKPFFVHLKIYIFKLLKPFGIAKLRRFFVADDAAELTPVMYNTFKKVVDEDFRDIFSSYRKKAVLFWGREDSATPLKSANLINSYIENSRLHVLSGEHYFFLKHSKAISGIVENSYMKEK